MLLHLGVGFKVELKDEFLGLVEAYEYLFFKCYPLIIYWVTFILFLFCELVFVVSSNCTVSDSFFLFLDSPSVSELSFIIFENES